MEKSNTCRFVSPGPKVMDEASSTSSLEASPPTAPRTSYWKERVRTFVLPSFATTGFVAGLRTLTVRGKYPSSTAVGGVAGVTWMVTSRALGSTGRAAGVAAGPGPALPGQALEPARAAA